MKSNTKSAPGTKLSLSEINAVHAVEGKPLTAEQIAMFEMFERENWSQDRRLAYIRSRIRRSAEPHAAE